MNEERERNLYTHVCFASIASGLSLILSLVVMLRYNYRTNLEIDYLGAIVAVLSLAVAIFVGVQIYQSFNLKRDIDEQNRKLLDESKDVFKEVKKDYQHQIELIKNENKKIEQDYQELEKSLKYTQSDITFSSIFNNTMILEREANDNFVQYIFDGYMDALNVAIQDKLADDRVEIVLTGLTNLTNRNANLIKNRFPILPNRYEYYYKILLNDRLTGERANRMKTFIKDNTIEVYTDFPPTYVRVISKYNPDYIAPKSNTK